MKLNPTLDLYIVILYVPLNGLQSQTLKYKNTSLTQNSELKAKALVTTLYDNRD